MLGNKAILPIYQLQARLDDFAHLAANGGLHRFLTQMTLEPAKRGYESVPPLMQSYRFTAASQFSTMVNGLASVSIDSSTRNRWPSPVTANWSHTGETGTRVGKRALGIPASRAGPGLIGMDTMLPSS